MFDYPVKDDEFSLNSRKALLKRFKGDKIEYKQMPDNASSLRCPDHSYQESLITMQRLFIYGTLAPGRKNHHVVESIPGSWETASLKGVLIYEGWGAETGYPGITPSADGDEVEGYILSSEKLSNFWAMLDQFEGDDYKRVPVVVKTNSGEEVEAYVYALNQSTT